MADNFGFRMIDDPKSRRELEAHYAQHVREFLTIIDLHLDQEEKEKLVAEARNEESQMTNPERFTDDGPVPDDAFIS